MQTYAIIFGVVALALLTLYLVWLYYQKKVEKLTAEITALVASNQALHAELQRALSRQEIERDVHKKTAGEVEDSVLGKKPAADGDPPPGGGPLSELR